MRILYGILTRSEVRTDDSPWEVGVGGWRMDVAISTIAKYDACDAESRTFSIEWRCNFDVLFVHLLLHLAFPRAALS